MPQEPRQKQHDIGMERQAWQAMSVRFAHSSKGLVFWAVIWYHTCVVGRYIIYTMNGYDYE